MPVAMTSDPKQAGQGLEAFAQAPEKETPRPTLTDVEAERIRDAVARGRFSKEIPMGADLQIVFSSLTDDEDRQFRRNKVMARRAAEKELNADIDRQFAKDRTGDLEKDKNLFKMFPTELEISSVADPEVMKINLGLHVKAINGTPVTYDQALGATKSWPTSVINFLLEELKTMYDEDLALCKKAVASSSNIKKS
jgi:hypothetical protein